MLEINKDRPSFRSKARRNLAAEMSSRADSALSCLLSLLRRMPENSKPQGCRCVSCGSIFQAPGCGSADMERMVQHYRSVDPHDRIAASKSGFYHQALHYLDSRLSAIQAVAGCRLRIWLLPGESRGFRWETLGVEIVPEAVLSAKGRVPAAHFLWRPQRCQAAAAVMPFIRDVLCHVEDPPLTEESSYFGPRRIIGIRVRNVTSQLWLYRCFSRLLRLWRKLGIKPLHVFHRYNFTRRAIEQILLRQGFANISIHNSPLTTGDPYQYFLWRCCRTR